MLRTFARPVALLASALALLACKRAPEVPQQPKVPTAVAAFTSGTISRESQIKVQFTDPIVAAAQVGAALERSPFETSPHIDGTARWTDRQTLVLWPSARLEPGRVYAVKLPLAPFLTVTGGASTLEFGFTVMRQGLEVRLDGLESASEEDSALLRFRATVVTADVADAAELERVFKAEQGGRALATAWEHDGLTHLVVVDGVTRAAQDSELRLSWDGRPIGAEASGGEVVRVPGLSSFGVVQVRAVQGDEQYVEVRFSDPLDRKQSLKGLVTLGDEPPRTSVEGSVLKLYAKQRIGGSAKLTLDAAVRSNKGYALGKPYVETVAFAPLEPAVRFAGKGVFVPTTDGLTLPVEAANVSALLVEAVRVPEQNIPQFLQVSTLEQDNELHRVGRVVWRQLVELGGGAEGKNRWVRVGLDLKPLIAKNPGGLYRLKVSFGRRQVTLDCPGAPSPAVEPQVRDDDFDSAGRDESAWDYAEETEGEDYAYEKRNDPCSGAFYRPYSGHQTSATRNVLVTDLALVAKLGGDGSLLVAATDIKTAEPRKGVDVEVLDFQQQRLATGATDGEGMVRLSLDHRPFVVIARSGADRGYLKLDDASALTLSHFDVGGAAVARGLKGKLFGERGVWRPGDELFLTFVLYDPDHHVPADHPVRFELVDPQGRIVDTQVRRESVGGFYALRTRTAASAPTGTYTARVRVGGATFEEPLKVEAVRPNRLKIGLDFGTQLITGSDELRGKLSSTWLHGALARNLKADVNVSFARRPTVFPRWAEYGFDDPVRRFEPESTTLFDGNLDEKGEAQVGGRLAVQGQAPGMLSAVFATRVFESGGVYSSDSFSVPFSPYPRYVGLRPPRGDVARGMLLTDQKHDLDLVAVGPDGELARGEVTVECKLYKLDWRWWWDRGEDASLANYVESSSHHPLAAGTVKLASGQGKWSFEVKSPEWGRFLLLVRDTKGGHRSGRIVYIDWPGWAGRGQKDGAGGATVLAFAADKQEYAVGETVTLTIPTAEKGRGLVSLETGTKVLQAEWLEAKGGETRYSFKATADMAPTVYAHVTLVQPHLQAKNDLPIRMYGVIPLKVVDPETRLTPVLGAPEVFAPESKAQVTVREAQGRPMSYTLAVVDEGLLGLTRFTTPNLWDAFYRREALGVRTWDAFDLVAGAYGASLERLLAIGGGDEAEAGGGRKANRFPPMVRFLGPFSLAKGDTARHELDVPRYVGAVRVMVVAGSGRAFGSTDKSVFVRKPLLVLATLPRVLGPEEEVDLPVTVFALEDKVKKATVRVSVSGPVTLAGSAAETLSFSGPGDRTVTFGLKARAEAGLATVDIVAEGAGETVKQTVELDVRLPGVKVTDVVEAVVEPGQSWSGEVPLPGFAGSNTALLEVSRVPPLDLGRRLAFLIAYPHGCVEQTTSSVFPQLYLSSLLDLPATTRQELERNIRAGIDRLQLFQTPSGGFAYWPGEARPDDWASSYAGHFLVEAKKAGYLVQDSVLEGWKRYQRSRVNATAPAVGGYGQPDLDQAYRLYTLALADAPELGAMNRLKESGRLSVTALWQLAAAYALAGKPEVARELTRSAPVTVPQYRELAFTYGSDVRDRAIILEALWTMKDLARGMPVAKELSASLSSRDLWLSTQEVAYALVALARYASATRGEDGTRLSYLLGAGAVKTLDSKAIVVQEKLPVGRSEKATLQATNLGQKPLYVRVLGTGLPRYETELDAENGLALSVDYETPEGGSLDPSTLDQGTDFVAKLTVRNVSARPTLKNLALTELVASGWEIRNQRIEGGVAPAQAGFDYQDVRDDRVLTYFGLGPNESRSFKVLLNASYTGRFYLPLTAVEAMYDGTLNGRVRGQWVRVKKPGTALARP
jgi:uncharacterized protein YfaS (alpha-2-macroglobulin family)